MDEMSETGRTRGLRAERADAAANRARIMAAAERLFAERAVAEVHMEEIAAAAQVGKGTLYRRFANKGELCLALLQCQFAQFQQRVETELSNMARSQNTYLDRAQWLLGQAIDFNCANLAMLCEATRFGAAAADAESQPVEWQVAQLQELLANALAAGELATWFAPAILADLLMAPLRPATLNFYRTARGYSVERLQEGIQQLFHQLVAE